MDKKEYGPGHSRVALEVREPAGRARQGEALNFSVPLNRGQLDNHQSLVLLDDHHRRLPCQAQPLAHWPDGSVKWCRVHTVLDVEAGGIRTLLLESSSSVGPHPGIQEPVRVVESSTGISLASGQFRFRLSPGRNPLGFGSGDAGGIESSAFVRLTDADGSTRNASFDPPILVNHGSLSATAVMKGSFTDNRGRAQLQCELRATVLAGAGALDLELTLWNPAAALHAGGLWDLGDPGSVLFRDLSLEVESGHAAGRVAWQLEADGPLQTGSGGGEFCVYQDSSGGPHWNAPNHAGRDGKPTVRFPGYKAWRREPAENERREIASGTRATPFVALATDQGQLAIEIDEFWQNFPKALRCSDGRLSAGLFPFESGQLYELQGGERKRHRLRLSLAGRDSLLEPPPPPLEVKVDPLAIERSGAIPWFSAGGTATHQRDYLEYVANIIEGPESFFAKRERADEFGWRHFGELHADHEAIHHRGDQPFVSHYNNQYDFIQGAILHFQRTGDPRWRALMTDLARHVMDIDVYRTQEDKPAFNGGLFWHTDHYFDAGTCTHRTYSRRNGGKGYGGGPSSEHNYTTGLLYYYYLTGDPDAAATVRTLADWVRAMDDGTSSPLALFDEGPTGAATSGARGSIPNRASGNSVNALLDAYQLTGARAYLDTAEAFIRRCIHPRDEVAAHGFDEPELTWSYLVFLQALGKYLELKVEFSEFDYMFRYARESLLRYADWMRDNERPYKDLLHKVEIPTETWPAHDIRKCHVFHLAARHSDGARREAYSERADFFYRRCIEDLQSFPTCHLTRPMVILAVYGGVHGYFLEQRAPLEYERRHSYDFGEPVAFVPQRARAMSSLKRKLQLVGREIRRQVRQRMGALWARRGR